MAILREIWNFSQFFKILMYLFHDFLQNHLQCFVEPWVGNADQMCPKSVDSTDLLFSFFFFSF